MHRHDGELGYLKNTAAALGEKARRGGPLE